MTIVHLRHPALLPYRLRTGKVVRLARTGLVTPIEITHLDADVVDVVHVPSSGGFMYALAEGALWNVVIDGRGIDPTSEADVVAWFEGDRPKSSTASLQRLLARTPLVRVDPHKGLVRDGEPLPHGSRSDEAMAEIMAGAARDFVAADLRLCQGCLLVRSRGPQVCVEDGRFVVTHAPAAVAAWRIHVRADQAGELWDLMAERGRVSGRTPRLPSWILSLPFDGDSDVVLAANESVSWAYDMLRDHCGDGQVDPAGRKVPMMAIRQDLDHLNEIASYGMVSLPEAENVLVRCAGAMKAIVDAGFRTLRPEGCHDDAMGVTREKLAFVEELLLPRVRAAVPIGDDDLDAMAGLSI